MFRSQGVPVASDKTEGSSSCITFLGAVVDYHCKSGSGEFGRGRLNLLVSHVGEFCPRDHIPWRIWSAGSEFGLGDFPLAC